MNAKPNFLFLQRDCEVIEIPSGNRTILSKGTGVRIFQKLGDFYTLSTGMGFLVRLQGKDADAIGENISKQNVEVNLSVSEEPLEKQIWDQLRTCYDPEIPINIVDLGLIYQCEIKPSSKEGKSVEIKMTLTAPGCGMGEVLKSDVESKVSGISGVDRVHIELVFDPPWDQSRMSEAARLELNLL